MGFSYHTGKTILVRSATPGDIKKGILLSQPDVYKRQVRHRLRLVYTKNKRGWLLMQTADDKQVSWLKLVLVKEFPRQFQQLIGIISGPIE